jgi:hypothetical protein
LFTIPDADEALKSAAVDLQLCMTTCICADCAVAGVSYRRSTPHDQSQMYNPTLRQANQARADFYAIQD